MIRLTHNSIDPAELIAAVTRSDCGGVVLFLGTVRDITGGLRTVGLDYDAYGTMAEKTIADITNEARSRWPVGEIAVLHRLGSLAICDVAVGVAVSCPHRTEAFAACQWIMDQIKTRAPIWKREHRPDGKAEWVHPGA